MRRFKHLNARTLQEAGSVLKKQQGKARIISGGTDILGQMKDDILPAYPEVLINIKTIPGLSYIKEEENWLKIGALTPLKDIANNAVIKDKYTALAQAAHRVASPNIREMGTIGGNICQSNRCWYYWSPGNRFNCMRKGESRVCYATVGDNRYHSIFGATKITETPCSSECPNNVDIPAYLSKIRNNDLPGAAQILLGNNPIPAITGRVCPHFCEQKCNRADFDESVSINSVERFMGDYILENASRMYTSPEKQAEKSIAIVGSGPAGLSAAYYLRKSGYRVTVFERMGEAGGLLTYGIPPYRLSRDVVKHQIKAFADMGIEFKFKTEVGKEITVAGLMRDYAAVFLAVGAWEERDMGIKGENLLNQGLEFLRKVNQGIRENPGKNAAVIGGGNVAIDVARTLLRMGTRPMVIYRRTEAEMPAMREEFERAKEEGVEFEFLTLPVEASKKGNKIALKSIRMKLGTADKTGRPRPVAIEGSEFSIEFEAVFKAVGEGIESSLVPAEFLDKEGRLKIDSSTHLLGKNLFAGGDFVSGPATVVAAIAGGREAANEIAGYLGTVLKNNPTGKSQNAETFNSLCLQTISRVKAPEISISEGSQSIDIEDVLTLGINEAKTEADRCFNCGCLAVNPSDIAPALIALNAKIKTTARIIDAEEFFAAMEEKSTILSCDELVTEIQIPFPSPGTCSNFIKFALRKSIDFSVVSCASKIESQGEKVTGARICLNAVYNNPYRATEAEDFIIGKSINETTSEAAGSAAIRKACPLARNAYKVQIAKTLVKRSIMACKM
jgi:NADPH-dependent glutamate synthase beta subunit-like oxidoreductase/CO/xanthine dehydrogenase FAD-binding subunit